MSHSQSGQLDRYQASSKTVRRFISAATAFTAALIVAYPAWSALAVDGGAEDFTSTADKDAGRTTADGWNSNGPADPVVLPSASSITNVAWSGAAKVWDDGAISQPIHRGGVLGDLDGDLDLDLVLTESNKGAAVASSVHLFNSNTGSFDTTGTPLPGSAGSGSREAKLADVDLDGDLDIILARDPEVNLLYRNRGGVFEDPEEFGTTGTDKTFSVAVADVTGDGWPDVAFANYGSNINGEKNFFYINDGAGGFSIDRRFGFTGDNRRTHAVVFGDLNLDGNPDVVMGNDDGLRNRYYLHNEGSLNVYANQQTDLDPTDNDGRRTTSLAIGDVDGDGDLDLVEANRAKVIDGGNGLNQPNRIHINQWVESGGTTLFNTANRFDLTDSADRNSHGVVLVDVNNDGRLDLVVGNRRVGLQTADGVQNDDIRSRNQLYLNSGNANPFDGAPIELGTETDDSRFILAGDVDLDGRVDVVAINEVDPDAPNPGGQVSKLYKNVGALDGAAAVQLAAVATSATVDTTNRRSIVLNATSSTGATDSVRYSVSNDGGQSWVAVNAPGDAMVGSDRGRPVGFPGGLGNDIRWRAELRAGSNGSAGGVNLSAVSLKSNDEINIINGGIPDVEQDEATAINLDTASYFNDPEGDPLIFNISGLPADTNLSLDPTTGMLTGTIGNAEAAASPMSIDVQATDGGQYKRQFFQLSVTGQVNDLPVVVTEIPDQVFDEGDAVILSVAANFDDPDDVLEFSAVGLPAGLTISAAGEISGTLGANDVGDWTVTVTATETRLTPQSVSDEFMITVNNVVNDAPELVTPIADTTATQGQPFSLDTSVNFMDPDPADVLSFSAVGLPASLSIDAGTGVISGTPTNDDFVNSPFAVTVTATDPGALSVDGAFMLSVDNSNDAPTVAAAIGAQTATQGVFFSLDVSANFSDPDPGDVLTFSATGLPLTMSIDANSGVISGTPSNDDVLGAPFNVTVTANDGLESVSDTFALSVDDANDAPVLATPIADQNVVQGTAVSLDVSGNFSDPDAGDTLSFSAAGLPASLSINAAGVIAGTPSQADVLNSPFTVSITATDSGGFSVMDEFQLSVLDATDAPVGNGIADQTGTQDQAFSYDASGDFSDPDGEALTFSATGLPAGFAMDGATGVITGTPSNADALASPFTVTVRAEDPTGLFAEETFELSITNVNDAPVLDGAVADVTADEGDDIVISVAGNVSDPDGDSLSFAATGLPASLSISSTGQITGTLTAADADASPFSVTITATDPGGLEVSATFELTVNAAPATPTTPPASGGGSGGGGAAGPWQLLTLMLLGWLTTVRRRRAGSPVGAVEGA